MLWYHSRYICTRRETYSTFIFFLISQNQNSKWLTDRHSLCCLWPRDLKGGRVIFGCRDGWVLFENKLHKLPLISNKNVLNNMMLKVIPKSTKRIPELFSLQLTLTYALVSQKTATLIWKSQFKTRNKKINYSGPFFNKVSIVTARNVTSCYILAILSGLRTVDK